MAPMERPCVIPVRYLFVSLAILVLRVQSSEMFQFKGSQWYLVWFKVEHVLHMESRLGCRSGLGSICLWVKV